MSNEPSAADLFKAAVGERVMLWRTTMRMTRVDLSAKAGVTVGYIARLERGQANPKVTTVQALAVALETSVQELLDVGGDELGIAAASLDRSDRH